MKNLKILLLIIIVSFSVGCKKAKLQKKIIGTWNVTKVSITANILTIPYAETDNKPTGTITFNKNKKGKQNYTFTFLTISNTQQGDFTWVAEESKIVTNENETWDRLLNEDNKQIVKFTDVVSATDTRTYTLTLEK